MEGLGKKFQDARVARGLTLDEAARLTKIRPSRLGEIEAEDFSNFPSLAYAKGFLLIYGKFLNVDVSSYLEAFDTSSAVTVDGYSYLQDNPAPKPTRTVIRAPAQKTSLLPLIVGIAVLVIGFSVIKLVMNIQRIAPAKKPPVAQATPTPAPATPPPAAPAVAATRTQSTPATARTTQAATAAAPTTAPVVAAVSTPVVLPTATPPSATPEPVASPAAAEPEVRRAEPVRPEDMVRFAPTVTPAPLGSGPPSRVDIRPLRRTFVKILVDNDSKPALERWISPNDGTIQVRGQRIAVRVLDREAVDVRKNGKPLTNADTDVTVE